jgi:hypothetical protein
LRIGRSPSHQAQLCDHVRILQQLMAVDRRDHRLKIHISQNQMPPASLQLGLVQRLNPLQRGLALASIGIGSSGENRQRFCSSD